MTGIKTTQSKQTMILINTKQANMTLMRKAAVNVAVGRQQTTLHWSSQDTANEVLEVQKTYSFFAHWLWGPTYLVHAAIKWKQGDECQLIERLGQGHMRQDLRMDRL